MHHSLGGKKESFPWEISHSQNIRWKKHYRTPESNGIEWKKSDSGHTITGGRQQMHTQHLGGINKLRSSGSLSLLPSAGSSLESPSPNHSGLLVMFEMKTNINDLSCPKHWWAESNSLIVSAPGLWRIQSSRVFIRLWKCKLQKQAYKIRWYYNWPHLVMKAHKHTRDYVFMESLHTLLYKLIMSGKGGKPWINLAMPFTQTSPNWIIVSNIPLQEKYNPLLNP